MQYHAIPHNPGQYDNLTGQINWSKKEPSLSQIKIDHCNKVLWASGLEGDLQKMIWQCLKSSAILILILILIAHHYRHSQESKQWWDARRFLTFENKVVCHKNVHFAGNVGGKWEVVDWWLVINYRSAASDKLTRILLSEALGYKHSPHLHKMKNTYLV